jgi:hypothetical protein
MPRFYFHLIGTRAAEHNEGTPFLRVDEAIEHATAVAHELAKNRHAEVNGQEIRVVDETGREMCRIPLN